MSLTLAYRGMPSHLALYTHYGNHILKPSYFQGKQLPTKPPLPISCFFETESRDVTEAGLELSDPAASVFHVLGLQTTN